MVCYVLAKLESLRQNIYAEYKTTIHTKNLESLCYILWTTAISWDQTIYYTSLLPLWWRHALCQILELWTVSLHSTLYLHQSHTSNCWTLADFCEAPFKELFDDKIYKQFRKVSHCCPSRAVEASQSPRTCFYTERGWISVSLSVHQHSTPQLLRSACSLSF